MNRYAFRFYKHDNMRFISHLDLQRLFKRAVRKAGIDVAFSSGFNPHELMNIVQPLSLGYEAEAEILEIDTNTPCNGQVMMDSINESLPAGIKLYQWKEFERTARNLSFRTVYGLYRVILPFYKNYYDIVRNHLEFEKPDWIVTQKGIDDFMSQDKILVTKRDKKTKQLVQKDVKALVKSMKIVNGPECNYPYNDQISCTIELVIACASNETLNPGVLIDSLLGYLNQDIPSEDRLISRMDLLGEENGKIIPVFELNSVVEKP